MLLLLIGCKVIDAPETIEELMIFGFVNHGQEDPEWASTFAGNLVPELDIHQEELVEGYRVDSLTEENIEATGVSSNDVNITGVSAETHMESDFLDVVNALTFTDTTQVFDATIAFELLEHSDRSCFIAQECEFYDYQAKRTLDLGILGQATQTFEGSFRWTELEDGTPAMMWRILIPDPAEVTTSFMAIHQSYTMDLIFPGDSGTRRVEAIWLDAEVIGTELPDSFLIDTAVKQMQSAAEDVDAFIASQ
jgi:hypothetical protein